MIPVNSSQINAMGQDQGVTRVEFKNGALYEYQNIPPELFEEIVNASSVGAVFNSKVKKFPNLYPYKKV